MKMVICKKIATLFFTFIRHYKVCKHRGKVSVGIIKDRLVFLLDCPLPHPILTTATAHLKLYLIGNFVLNRFILSLTVPMGFGPVRNICNVRQTVCHMRDYES